VLVWWGGGALACAGRVTIYRRKLPHIEEDGSSYFINFHTREDLTLNDEAKWLVSEPLFE
jgi:hypothetical protein